MPDLSVKGSKENFTAVLFKVIRVTLRFCQISHRTRPRADVTRKMHKVEGEG